jgi:hypothetical protein
MSLGLLSMRERAAAIGADLDIVSRTGAGTIVVLRRPWENDLVRPAPEARLEDFVEDVELNGASTNGVHDTEQVPEAQNA